MCASVSSVNQFPNGLTEFWTFLKDANVDFVDKNGFAGAFFLDPSKAFDSMNHDLISKLHASCALSINPLEFIHNPLSKSNRMKTSSAFSACKSEVA